MTAGNESKGKPMRQTAEPSSGKIFIFVRRTVKFKTSIIYISRNKERFEISNKFNQVEFREM